MDIAGFQKLLASILAGTETSVENVPETKVSDGSKIFGIIKDPITRALYSLYVRVGQYFVDYRTAHLPGTIQEFESDNPEELRKHTFILDTVNRFREALRSLIWTRIGIELPDIANAEKDLFIGKDWQIAESGKENEYDKPKISVIAVGVPPRTPVITGKN